MRSEDEIFVHRMHISSILSVFYYETLWGIKYFITYIIYFIAINDQVVTYGSSKSSCIASDYFSNVLLMHFDHDSSICL